MTRRKVIATAAAAAAAASAQPPAGGPPQTLLLRRYQLRNSGDAMGATLAKFLEISKRPALERAGAQGLGFFSSFIGPDTPYYLTLESYPSLGALEEGMNRLAADRKFQAELAAFNKTPGQRFVRYSTEILKGFTGFPGVVAPPPAKTARLFELRTYESDDATSLAEKIRMFNEGEIAIFQKTGLNPVFFGETIIGEKQPNLTYLLWYDSLAAREANWSRFVAHPEWLKLRATPGWSDGEIVSNISNSLLRPLPFSPIR
ncbi:MAG: NIPSNAP family protein [Acidobacteria bacterium]|nr:NIPSNAP family protein [Acidobacteriota bacterium]